MVNGYSYFENFPNSNLICIKSLMAFANLSSNNNNKKIF